MIHTRTYYLALALFVKARAKGYRGNTYGLAKVGFDEIPAKVGFQDPDIMRLRNLGIVTLESDGVNFNKTLLDMNFKQITEHLTSHNV